MPPSTTTRPDAAPKRKRGEGQWKLGHREPLNPNERTKKDDDGLNVRARIENVYSKRGFDSIDPADLRGRMRWWGLYTQRRPGIDGGRTAVLEPEELDDRYFMLRVRARRRRADHRAAARPRRDLPDLRPRHRRRHGPAEHPVPLDRDRGHAGDLAAAREPRHDHHRGVRRHAPRDPRLAGRRHRRRRGDRPAARRSTRSSSATSATRRSRTCPASSRRRSPGSRTSRTRSTTSRSSASCTPSTARASTSGSAAGCRPTRRSRSGSAPGCRSTRSPTSGPASSRSSATTATAGCGTARGSSSSSPTGAPRSSARCWRTSTCTASWSTAPRPATPERPIDHVGVHKQRDGLNYVGVAPASGRVSGTTLVALADAAERAGSGRVRLTPQQKIVVLDVPDAQGRARSRRAQHAGPAGRAVAVAALDHGLHRHRVLQARDRRDQGAGDPAGRGAGEAPGRRAPGRADLHPPQRLPERLRPHPGRGHRAQGPDRHRRRRATRSRASRCTWAAGSGSTPASAASCAGSRSPAPSWATTSTGWCGGSASSARAGERFAQWVAAGRRGRPEVMPRSVGNV